MPAGFRVPGFPRHSSPDQQGHTCRPHHFCFLLRSDYYIFIRPHSMIFLSGFSRFLQSYTMVYHGWLCTRIANIRSSCLFSSLSLPGSPETRVVHPNLYNGRHAARTALVNDPRGISVHTVATTIRNHKIELLEWNDAFLHLR